MLRSAVAIAGIIGLAAISHRLLRHYLTSSKSQTHMSQSQDKNKNKAACTEEAMMSNSKGIDVLDDRYNLSKLSQDSLFYDVVEVAEPVYETFGVPYSIMSDAFDVLGWNTPILGNVMEVLTDPNTHLIGFYGSQDEIKDALLQKVYRRVQRDQLFGMVVKATVTKHPDVRKIQEDIASQLGLTFSHKSRDKRAQELIHRIKNEQNMLIVLGERYNKSI